MRIERFGASMHVEECAIENLWCVLLDIRVYLLCQHISRSISNRDPSARIQHTLKAMQCECELGRSFVFYDSLSVHHLRKCYDNLQESLIYFEEKQHGRF
jgi:hypothetical protein